MEVLDDAEVARVVDDDVEVLVHPRMPTDISTIATPTAVRRAPMTST